MLLHEKTHIVVDSLFNKLPEKTQRNLIPYGTTTTSRFSELIAYTLPFIGLFVKEKDLIFIHNPIAGVCSEKKLNELKKECRKEWIARSGGAKELFAARNFLSEINTNPLFATRKKRQAVLALLVYGETHDSHALNIRGKALDTLESMSRRFRDEEQGEDSFTEEDMKMLFGILDHESSYERFQAIKAIPHLIAANDTLATPDTLHSLLRMLADDDEAFRQLVINAINAVTAANAKSITEKINAFR